ncbi:spore germination protein [Cohnella lupini]|uniref:Spore germination protein KA/spore germination protein n=1 Tax=Cohnella lupini TaxID=1294267 RepID=A0A3D9IV13_9BACL|nr:spore germination protein [Cohnella lupini]RED65525.1 spore germination protein KA/spore germination protein [Cohnella lupini]
MSYNQEKESRLMDYLTAAFCADADFVSRNIPVLSGKAEVNVQYIENLIENEMINENVIVRLQDGTSEESDLNSDKVMDIIRSTVVSVANVYSSNDKDHLLQAILTGHVAITVNDIDYALVIPLLKREVGEKSETEPSLQSGNEAFTSNIYKNFNLLRMRLPSLDLMFKQMELGRTSHTKVRIVWLNNIAKPPIIEEVCSRLNRIDIDIVRSISVITELIEDNPLSFWPQCKLTERVDVTVANMAEGRVAILCDNFSFVILVPLLVLQEFQTPDDYSQKWMFSSIMRIVRYCAFFLSSTLSALYVSFVAFNHSIMPPDLAIHISAGRSEVPFPSVIEVLLMTFMIDVLKEAGIRLPKGLGQSIGFLGAVVIGQSAVEAGYVSPVVIIIVAISAVSSFALPSISLTNMSRVTNYVFILLATVLGLFGVLIGILFLQWRLMTLRSFGIPISHPLGLGEISQMKDLLIRSPAWKLRKRPKVLSENETAMGDRTRKPGPKG